MSLRKIFRISDVKEVIDQINYLDRNSIRRVLKRLFQSLSQKECNTLLETAEKINKIEESESHSLISKIVSRSDEEKTVTPHYQSARLHDQKAADESVKKSESESSKDSDVTVERFKQKFITSFIELKKSWSSNTHEFSDRDTDAEAVTEDEMKSVAQIEVKVKSAAEDIYEKKDEEKSELTEADKQ
ncbi:hypothetical protein BDBG_16575 [Blastomyces gilchristii SLH14081]|uniref:Uncharacterized protein n=1 Tax=Blastomyces gilchristii (strain SLH14081) TaxID=559298 RepID=A0A179UEA3_BLAGS|nr:uncharacterized protein BDBG_16575 [Blastomyces gilchristii SLH14081]OAT06190.1 hypothetical protein BDBG_16575 [Blastomyces gilchristii SLH14081]